jgi:hypothetical protein
MGIRVIGTIDDATIVTVSRAYLVHSITSRTLANYAILVRIPRVVSITHRATASALHLDWTAPKTTTTTTSLSKADDHIQKRKIVVIWIASVSVIIVTIVIDIVIVDIIAIAWRC